MTVFAVNPLSRFVEFRKAGGGSICFIVSVRVLRGNHGDVVKTILSRNPHPHIPVFMRLKRFIEQAQRLEAFPCMHDAQGRKQVFNQKSIRVEGAGIEQLALLYNVHAALQLLHCPVGVGIGRLYLMRFQKIDQNAHMVGKKPVVVVEIGNVFSPRGPEPEWAAERSLVVS